jgi:TIR domain
VKLADYPYRVFVSYADEDRQHASRIVSRLRDLDLQPVWDQDNRGGWPFLELTKRRIAHSHVFLPLLTTRSVRSTWVNHEIGFAVGRNVPVLPLSLGPMPSGMAGALHAEVADHIDDLLKLLTRERINGLVEGNPAIEVYEVADHSDHRTAAIISHCKELASLAFPQPQRLRHRAAFGSFSLPANPDDPIWARRYDGEPWRVYLAARKEALSEERRLLERHALQFGCDLILYPSLPHLTRAAIAARIEILRGFLVDMSKTSAPVRVIFHETALKGNVIIVADWFWSESVTPQAGGYRHTTLTSHAPTVFDRIVQYERIFDVAGKWMPAEGAIEWLDQHTEAYVEQGLTSNG